MYSVRPWSSTRILPTLVLTTLSVADRAAVAVGVALAVPAVATPITVLADTIAAIAVAVGIRLIS
jgi:hypothetical protein